MANLKDDQTLAHMIARFQVKTGYKPSAREISALYKAAKYVEADMHNSNEGDK